MPTASNYPRTFRALLLLLTLALASLVSGCAGVTGDDEELGELQQAACTGPTVVATPSSPQTAGTNVTLTASGATCAMGEAPEYRFAYIREGTTTAVQIRGYGLTPSTIWNTTGLPSGAYNVIVYVRAFGSTAASQGSAYLSPKYLIGNVCNDTTAFTTSPAAPQAPGTMVGLSSTASCTGGTPEFRYAYRAPGSSSYVFVGPFGPANQTWNTTGLPAGSYTLIVYTRATGNLSTSESVRYATYLLGSTCTNAGGSASPVDPQPPGTAVTLTGTATCGSPQYRFSYRLSGAPTWIQLGGGGFGANNQVWDTTALGSGLYQLLVEVRQSGNTGGAESTFVFTYALGGVCGPVTLATNPASPQAPGIQVDLTGTTTCSGGATPEYRFSYRPNGTPTYTLIRDYGAATATWDTTGLPLASYTLRVETRAVGSTSPFEAAAVASYTLTAGAISQVSAGTGLHVCARANNGTAACWGANDAGQLGDGSVSASSSTPVQVSGLNTVIAVAAGGFHSCALLADGTVSCWGENADGQLGNGTTTPSPTPVAVSSVTGATAIGAGTFHTCALLSAGDVMCWGNNSYLQAGSTLATDYPSALLPVLVAGTTGATELSVGGFHACVNISGAMSCWGSNSLGQLGNGGTPVESASAVPVTGLGSGVTSISAGDSHSCAVAGGGVQCWGDNTYGQLGNGTTSMTPTTTPGAVGGVGTVASVHAGFTFSCVRLTNRTVRCWGRNGNGELGDGTGTDHYTPAPVSGLSTATSLTTGAVTSCVTVLSGGAQCWGYGAQGALGNGGSSDALSPVNVSYP